MPGYMRMYDKNEKQKCQIKEKQMTAGIQNFWKFKPLLEELVSRDVKIKYRRSVLGVLWTLLNPLLMMMAYHQNQPV